MKNSEKSTSRFCSKGSINWYALNTGVANHKNFDKQPNMRCQNEFHPSVNRCLICLTKINYS